MNYILQNTTLYVGTYMLEVIQLDLWIKINLFIYNNIEIKIVWTQIIVNIFITRTNQIISKIIIITF